ncbi:MAG TPA: nuclear transport factor 2 family protein [Solirubrobacteraceae bacterium]|nr:nuclear transport factor 2 family protein [Solirubrobacteraceae bacterium]
MMTLQQLLDHHEIVDLVSRLGLWLDDKRWDDASAILTADATAKTLGGTVQGRDALVEQARRNHPDGTGTQHVITNCVVDLQGDRAEVRANLIVSFFSATEIGEPARQIGERYRFDAVRTDVGWRLAGVRALPMWLDGALPGD